MGREPEDRPDDLAEIVRHLEARIQAVEADARKLRGELDEAKLSDEVRLRLQTMAGGLLG